MSSILVDLKHQLILVALVQREKKIERGGCAVNSLCDACAWSQVLEFQNNLWELGTEQEQGYRYGPPGYMGGRAVTTTRFLLGSQPPQIVLKFQHRLSLMIQLNLYSSMHFQSSNQSFPCLCSVLDGVLSANHPVRFFHLCSILDGDVLSSNHAFLPMYVVFQISLHRLSTHPITLQQKKQLESNALERYVSFSQEISLTYLYLSVTFFLHLRSLNALIKR